MNPISIAALLACAALSLTACAGVSRPTTSAPTAAATAAAQSVTDITVANIAFDPPTVEIGAGTEVVWRNEDGPVQHTVTSGLPGDSGIPGVRAPLPNKPDGLFDGSLGAGQEFRFRFDRAGTYAYFCAVHPSMTGEVVVS